MNRFLIFACAATLFAQQSSAQTCYTSNGAVAEDDKPCRPDDPHSSCCGGTRYTCSTNGLCGSPADGSFFVVGSCTDPTWEDPSCPNVCFADSHINNSVIKCLRANTYCCGDGPKCDCDTGNNTQTFPDIQPDYSILTALPTTTTSSSRITTSSATPSAVSTTSKVGEPSHSHTSVSPDSIQTSGSAPVTTSSNAVQSSSNGGDSHSLAIGLGIGLGIALILALAGLGAFFYRRSRKNKREQAAAASETAFAGMMPEHTTVHPVEVDGREAAKIPHNQMVYEAPGSYAFVDNRVPKYSA